MTSKHLLILLLAFTIVACSNEQSALSSYFSDSNISTYANKIDTPDYYYQYAKEIENELELGSLEKGIQGFEMRFWYYPEIGLTKKLITVSYSGNTWNAKVYSIRKNHLNENPDLVVDSALGLTPSSGWKRFQDSLVSLRVKELPQYSYLPGDQLLDDGITYFAEIANTNSFQFVWYTNPQADMKTNHSAATWQAVVDLYNREFPHAK